MSEAECCVGDVSGGSESSELDYDSLDFAEEGPAIAEGPSDNYLPVRAYQYEPYLDAVMHFLIRLDSESNPEKKLSSTDFKTALVNLY